MPSNPTLPEAVRAKPLRLEPMDCGLLVIGTDQIVEAEAFAKGSLPERWDSSHPGWYRKVPAQWSDWSLYRAEPHSRGAFRAVQFLFEHRAQSTPETTGGKTNG